MSRGQHRLSTVLTGVVGGLLLFHVSGLVSSAWFTARGPAATHLPMLMMLALILLAAVLGTVRPRAGLVAGLLVLGLSLLGTFVLSSDPWTEVSSWLDWRGAASAAAGGSYSAMLGLTLVCVSLAPRARRWWLTRRRGQEPLRAEEESRPVATSRT